MRSGERNIWVWAEALELLQASERWQRRIFAVEAAHAPPCWQPAVDLFQDGAELTLLVALPGVDPRRVEVVLDAADVLVRGERAMPSAGHRAAIHRLEIPYGRFERRIALPAGDFALQQQFFDNGCLVLLLRQLG
jgi:HSP20 family protein